MTVAQEAHNLLKNVPTEDWLIGKFSDGKSKCCAIGHWSRLKSNDPKNYKLNNCIDDSDEIALLRKLSENFAYIHLNGAEPCAFLYYNIVRVNNNISDRFPQETPKERVLTFLQMMIEHGY